ncbi:MAG: transketolase [Saccharofermentanales bacterium]|jgi:transketolase
MELKKVKELQIIATEARLNGLEAIHCANSGHVGGAFSSVDIMALLFFDKMKNIDPKNPKRSDRDRFVLSKGHCTAALYPILAQRGFFPVEDLKTFRKIDSYLSGHVEMNHVPGVDMSSGSLGQGLSVAVGMAIGGKLDKKDFTVYAMMGDGEIQEGQIWEAAMAAAKYKLDNLIGIVDYNGLQIDGTVEDIMPIEPLADKWIAFGWEVFSVDGHDFVELSDTFDKAKSVKGKPIMIIANTVKGKGVSFMENNLAWHGSPPNEDEYQRAKKELQAQLQKLEG